MTVVSETKRFRLDRSCSGQSINLCWLNSLGGWEYWTFTARKTYGDEVSDKQIIEKDILQDWDDEFINSQTQEDTISVRSRRTRIVRSQILTEDEAFAINEIKKSIKVQDITDIDNPVTVQVTGSRDFFTDVDKVPSIEFTIRYPFDIIQSQ